MVSLFTREWIEICCTADTYSEYKRSPSLRGSGLKSCYLDNGDYAEYVSLFTREWIEMVVCVSGLPK